MGNILFEESSKYFNEHMLDDVQKRVYRNSQEASKDDYEMPEDVKPFFTRQEELKGKYKIQILFGPKRSSTKSLCMVHVFESGGKLHEHQDQLCYFCWDIEDRRIGCRGVIPASKITGGVGWCDKCKGPRATSKMTEFIVYHLPMSVIAENVYKLFRTLNSDADIYIKFAKNDIRKLTEMGERGLRDMQAIEDQREAVIYPLKHILKDVSNGSNVVHKIETFLKA